jgi:hypothetical protein
VNKVTYILVLTFYPNLVTFNIDLDALELEDNLANVIPTCLLERQALMPPRSGVGPLDQGTEVYLGHDDWVF